MQCILTFHLTLRKGLRLASNDTQVSAKSPAIVEKQRKWID